MIEFSSISFFQSRLTAMKNVKRGVYATVEDEVKAAFRGFTIEQIRQNYDMILLDDPRIVIKLRLPDKKHRLSKRDGYRLIYLVYKDREEVALLDVYPKNGPMQQLDIADDEVVELVRQYIDEKERGVLIPFEI